MADKMVDHCSSLSLTARAHFSSRQNLEVEAIAPFRTAMRSKMRKPTPQSMKVADTTEGRKCTPRTSLSLPSAQYCRPVAKAAACQAETWPSDLPMLPLPALSSGVLLPREDAPTKIEIVDLGEMSPNTITDAALYKSQQLLEHLLSLDISDERTGVPRGAAEMGKDTEDVADTQKSSTWSWPTETVEPASVQVPAKFLELFGEMWEQFKCNQAIHETRCDDQDQVSVGSTYLPSRSSLSSPDCMTPATSPGSSATSIHSPIEYCSLSPSDKAQLIQDLREALCASSLPEAVAPTPLLRSCARSPSSLSIPAAVSPRQLPRAVALQPSLSHASLAPIQIRGAMPTGRLVWQPIAVTTVHHVLLAC